MTVRLFLALIATFGFAAPADTYSYLYGGKTVVVSVEEMDGVRVNDICVQKGASCKAILALHGASRVSRLTHAPDADIPGAYCKLLHGTRIFLHRDPAGSALFCLFDDLTMVDAKALYRAHAGQGGGHP